MSLLVAEEAVVTADYVQAMEAVAYIANNWERLRNYETTDGCHLILEDQPWMAPYAKHLLARVGARLEQKLNRHLFGASVDFKSEQAALATLKGVALELQHAGLELQVAAERFKSIGGQIASANRAFTNHRRAMEVAGPYLG